MIDTFGPFGYNQAILSGADSELSEQEAVGR